MNYRWSIHSPQPELAAALSQELRLPRMLVQCLFNRGYHNPERIARFLDARLKQLADPFLLPDMARAVERLFLARQRGEGLVIFGDYDVDGVTSTALLTEVLQALGWKVSCYLPHRLEEGYGLSQTGIDNCLTQYPATLVLAVDCGSTAQAAISELKTQGIEVIVLDHHQPSTPAPDAVALVNPLLASPGHPAFPELCSVGLAFKLAHAVLKRGRDQGLPEAFAIDLRNQLDLVALGTIADLVPLTGENRILATSGLKHLQTTRRPGLIALKNVAGIGEHVGAYEVGFQLAPRLNAAGRVENALDALHLLLARETAAAMPLAQRLDAQNRERQAIERAIVTEVSNSVRASFDAARDFVIVEGQRDWHIGVVGIVAARVLQQFYRPTIILGGDANHWRGSGRSIPGFDLAAALRECDDLLIRHGGHTMAAGLSLEPANLGAFRERLNQIARRTLQPEQLQPELCLDAEVCLPELSLAGVKALNALEPAGMGNPPVRVAVRGLTLQREPRRMGTEQQHVKLWVTDGQAVCEVVWWRAGTAALPTGRFDLAVTPQINEFNGSSTVQLKLLNWRPA